MDISTIDETDAQYIAEIPRSSTQQLSSPHFEDSDRANETSFVELSTDTGYSKKDNKDAEHTVLSLASDQNSIRIHDIHTPIDSSYEGGTDSCIDDVILYPAGGAFNKLRKKQQYLESLLKLHWYAYSQTHINFKKEYVIKNILAPLYSSGRQFKIYNPNYRQNGEDEYIIPNIDVAFERMAQKLRDMKKTQTAEMYHNIAKAGIEKGTKRKQSLVARNSTTATVTTTTSITEPSKKKRKSRKISTSEELDEENSFALAANTARGKKKRSSDPEKKMSATNASPKPRKQSPTSTSKRARARLQNTPLVGSKKQTKKNTTMRNDTENKGEVVLLGDNHDKETVVTISISQQNKPTQLISSTSSLISNGSQERNHSQSAFSTRGAADATNPTMMMKKKKYNGMLLFSNENDNYSTSNTMDGTGAPEEGMDDLKKYIIRVPVLNTMNRRGSVSNQSNKTDNLNDDEVIDFSDDDDNYAINTTGMSMTEPTISWSSTIEDRNKLSKKSANARPHHRTDDVNATISNTTATASTTTATATTTTTTRSRTEDLSLTELKEIIWSQWEQIDCWRRLCRQYRETYNLQRDVILQQDKLLASSSSSSSSSSQHSKIGVNSNSHLLSIPCLSYDNKSNIRHSYPMSTMNESICQPITPQTHHHRNSLNSTTTTTDRNATTVVVDHTTTSNHQLCTGMDTTCVNEKTYADDTETKITICEV